MSRTIIEDGNYTFSTPEGWSEAQPVGYMPAILRAAEAFLALDKALDEIPDEGITKYHNSIQLRSIVLDIEGTPWGQIMYLDDAVQFIPFKQESKK